MKRILKILLSVILIVGTMAGLAACGNSTAFEKKNKDWLHSADRAIGYNISLQDDMTWGMTRDEVAKVVSGPFEDDYETYISKWISASLPSDGSWTASAKKVNADAFAKSQMRPYYAFDENGKLYEYGYQHISPTLEQYDFLKEYYSKKYGGPQKEEYIWNDKSYKPSGKEDLHAMFKKGQVKVLTAWDIDELGSVLVVDWLSDPIKKANNFGQITFYEKTGELTFDEANSANN